MPMCKNLIRLLICCLIFLAVSCRHKKPVYSNLRDFGYNGKVRSITTRAYSPLSDFGRELGPPKYTLVQEFNADGNYTTNKIMVNSKIYTYAYEYKDHVATGWTRYGYEEVLILCQNLKAVNTLLL